MKVSYKETVQSSAESTEYDGQQEEYNSGNCRMITGKLGTDNSDKCKLRCNGNIDTAGQNNNKFTNRKNSINCIILKCVDDHISTEKARCQYFCCDQQNNKHKDQARIS